MLLALQPRDFEIVHDVDQGEESVVHARARLIRKFLESDASHLLFLDADVACHPEVVRGMMHSAVTLRARDGEAPILLTPYPRKRIDWDRIESHVRLLIVEALRRAHNSMKSPVEMAIDIFPAPYGLEAHGQSYPIQFRPDGLELDTETFTAPVLGAGIGCSVWSREALEAIEAAAGDGLDYHDGPTEEAPLTCAVTMLVLENRALMSEDLSLCWRARQIGLTPRLYLGPGSPAGHVGPYFFPGKIEAFGVKGAKR